MEHSSHKEREAGHGLPDKSVQAAHDFIEHAEHDREEGAARFANADSSFWLSFTTIANMECLKLALVSSHNATWIRE
ncbi:unnamed protein product [Parascedosporium putredinis]|uniref:Uncharacterized protein n=1 Tax=Parascedosporium putredinis TaxID=1442378 RepID=A0A9P1M803_9PEZI|nr:unnamed protein product [Parascedosporium putredinis]CAI7991623.1 unnamed protein product [Parascedosporium putredinis]